MEMVLDSGVAAQLRVVCLCESSALVLYFVNCAVVVAVVVME
jgi:hypothetical protein